MKLFLTISLHPTHRLHKDIFHPSYNHYHFTDGPILHPFKINTKKWQTWGKAGNILTNLNRALNAKAGMGSDSVSLKVMATQVIHQYTQPHDHRQSHDALWGFEKDAGGEK